MQALNKYMAKEKIEMFQTKNWKGILHFFSRQKSYFFSSDYQRFEVYLLCWLVVFWSPVIWNVDGSVPFQWLWWGWIILVSFLDSRLTKWMVIPPPPTPPPTLHRRLILLNLCMGSAELIGGTLAFSTMWGRNLSYLYHDLMITIYLWINKKCNQQSAQHQNFSKNFKNLLRLHLWADFNMDGLFLILGARPTTQYQKFCQIPESWSRPIWQCDKFIAQKS